MKKISDNNLLRHYISKYNLETIFDEDLLKHAQLHFYQKGEYILESNFNLEYYYLIVDGKVTVSYLLENGKSILLKFYHAFNTLGDIELLKNIPICCNNQAIEDSYLVAIPSDIIRNKYLDNPKFLHHLINSLSEKLYATLNNSSYNLTYPLINRLSSYLVEYISNKNYIVLSSSFNEIAQFLGTSYRHLNRTFKELESRSIIKCENKTIHILDKDTLLELSKNDYIKSL
ncbi:Crp/Fnr family transcriptional regulator [Tepidibacter hydrothermalis]|uniref:Cyclic nucleotide-binding domain-containing protein n=1 Tax=Tepidibacter hydrothermalis TaxID=3036126 RepID=A0ABY8EBB6_9FIRM|nr:cyclic nucleotide-binding domain-containing protein [Tepidibacter hydrothermalis]WFD10211.1 cyclic nucleotide-binding domain-containing protein [Tepidibacter hydrothermalis]